MKKTIAELIKESEGLPEEERQAFLERPVMDDAEIAPLVQNKEKILSELKQTQNRLKNEKMSESDREKLTLLENSSIMGADELEKVLTSGTSDLDKATLKIKQLESQSKKFQSEAEIYRNNFQVEQQKRLDVAKKQAIQGELARLNVNPNSMDILESYFANQLNTHVGEDGTVSVVSASDEFTPATEVLRTWSETEQSKQFIQAPINQGAGSNSGNDSPSVKMSLEQISQIPDRNARLKAMQDNGY